MKYIKTCPICGNVFETNRSQKIYCDNIHYLPCPVCGKLVEKKDNDFSRPPKCCSAECAHKLRSSKIAERKCKICGKMFQPTSGSALICSDQHFINCVICKKLMPITPEQFHKGLNTCSEECLTEKIRQSNIEKYGCEHPMQNQDVQSKHKASMMVKYGVSSPLQSEEIRAKVCDSNRERFGVDWALSSDEIREKSKQTMMEKYGGATTLESPVLKEKVKAVLTSTYGHSNPSKILKFREAAQQTLLERYGVTNPMQDTEIQLSAMKTRVEHYGEFWPAEIDAKAKL